jgi:DNA-binding IclR family transcriptional regulator
MVGFCGSAATGGSNHTGAVRVHGVDTSGLFVASSSAAARPSVSRRALAAIDYWERVLKTRNNTMGTAQKRTPKMGSVASAIALLRLLSEREQPLGVNAIARELSLAPSSCFKILKSLLVEDFVEFDTRTKSYSVGCGAIAVAHRALDSSRAFSNMRPLFEELAYDHSIAVGLWRLVRNSRMVLIGFVEGRSQMRIHMSIGQRVPRLVGAMGRAVAAHLDLPKDELRREFDTLTWQSPLSFADYVMQVEQAKRVGYGIDEGNFALGVSTAAVAVIDDSGAIGYGISGIMFSGQHNSETMNKIAQRLVTISQAASVRLVGHAGTPGDAVRSARTQQRCSGVQST